MESVAVIFISEEVIVNSGEVRKKKLPLFLLYFEKANENA